MVRHPAFLALLVLLGIPSVASSQAPAQRWSIDLKPIFDVGAESEDTLETFGEVVGATRIANGEVVVADRKAYALRYFASDGRYLRSVGRQGVGPAEFPGAGIMKLFRCGELLYAQLWALPTWKVFSARGGLQRSVTVVPPPRANQVYKARCNDAGQFIAYGWEPQGSGKPGYFRPRVPFWIANTDGSVRAPLGELPGPDRWGLTKGGQLSGTGPLPLGKSPLVALGRNRVYVTSADSFLISVYSLDGKSAGTIRKQVAPLRTTPADIQLAILRDTAGQSAENIRWTMTRMHGVVEYPRTVPAFLAMLVDTDDNLWVQRFPRGGERTSHWVVFSPTGAELAQIDLPLTLAVEEIGKDYVLGIDVDPVDGVHHVKMYRLKRTGGR